MFSFRRCVHRSSVSPCTLCTHLDWYRSLFNCLIKIVDEPRRLMISVSFLNLFSKLRAQSWWYLWPSRKAWIFVDHFRWLWQYGRRMVFGIVFGPHCSDQTVWSGSTTSKYSRNLAGIKGYETTNMQIAKIRKNKAAILSHSDSGTRIQDRGNTLQSGGPHLIL